MDPARGSPSRRPVPDRTRLPPGRSSRTELGTPFVGRPESADPEVHRFEVSRRSKNADGPDSSIRNVSPVCGSFQTNTTGLVSASTEEPMAPQAADGSFGVWSFMSSRWVLLVQWDVPPPGPSRSQPLSRMNTGSISRFPQTLRSRVRLVFAMGSSAAIDTPPSPRSMVKAMQNERQRDCRIGDMHVAAPKRGPAHEGFPSARIGRASSR